MKIPLNKQTALKMFCYCRQGSRSLHRGLGGNWPDLQKYYNEERIAAIQQLVNQLAGLLPPGSLGLPATSREQVGRSLPEPGLFRVLFGKWIARRKTHWSFRSEDIQFVAKCLNSLLRVLALPTDTDTTFLIGLRMDLSAGEGIVEQRCYGLPEFARAIHLEHFDMTPWLPSVRLEEILGEMPSDEKPARQSA